MAIKTQGIMYGDNGAPIGADLRYESLANQHRGRADSFSKILFQQRARADPLRFESLVERAGAQPIEDLEEIEQPVAGNSQAPEGISMG